ncbi:MAG TPA: hypothetical protein VGF61_07945 [Candidatus Acidoferrum sp.]|jgi:hypothetical protein
MLAQQRVPERSAFNSNRASEVYPVKIGMIESCAGDDGMGEASIPEAAPSEANPGTD